LEEFRVQLYSNRYWVTYVAKAFGQLAGPRQLDEPPGGSLAPAEHALVALRPVVPPFVRLRKLDVMAAARGVLSLLQLAPRTLSELSVDSAGGDSLVALFRAIAGFELLTELNLNMAGFGGTHVSREALLLLANLHCLRVLTVCSRAKHEKVWATSNVDDAGVAHILAGPPHLASFDFLLSSDQVRLRLHAALMSAGEHCRGLRRLRLCGRLRFVSLPPSRQPPLFPVLEELQCFGFDYDAVEAAHSSSTSKAIGLHDSGQNKCGAVTAQRILCHAPKLQRLQLTKPTEQDNKVLELWDRWNGKPKGAGKQKSSM
jgi:hypothetical protein